MRRGKGWIGLLALIVAGGLAGQSVAEGRTGEEVYRTSCFACHQLGVAGAPKLDDQEAWAPRLAQGRDMLRVHVLKGLNMMPPRGACGNCSDEELERALDYMIPDPS